MTKQIGPDRWGDSQIDEKRPKVVARGTAMPLTNTDFEEIEKRTAPRFSKLPTVLEATLYSPAWRIQLRARKGLKMISEICKV